MTRASQPARSTTWARYRPPNAQAGVIDRPRLLADLDATIAAHRVTVVCGPSGFGKTSIASAWARRHAAAWLSLGPFDSDPAPLSMSVIEALQTAASAHGFAAAAPLQGIDPRAADLGGTYRALCDALAALDEQIALVVDDAHRAADTFDRNLLGALINDAPENLRIIVVGTTLLEVSLSRLLVAHPGALIDGSALSFTEHEIAQLLEHSDSHLTPAVVHEETDGWPIAVRVMMLGDARPPAQATATPETAVRDYIRQHVLRPLPTGLVRVILDTSIIRDLTPELAIAITGRQDATTLLEDCARLGLFLDRIATGQSTVYRWHSYFARQCRAILEVDNPGRLLLLHHRAALALEDADPITAISHHLAADAPDDAVRLIARRWVRLVMGTEAGPLDRLCATLPSAARRDPRILFIRACAQDVIGEHVAARILFAEAEAAAAKSGSPGTLTQALASVILLDDRDAVEAAIHRVLAMSDEIGRAVGQDRAWSMYLLGWTQLRLRTDPHLAIELMTAALREAEAVGARELTDRIRGHLATLLVWAGHLVHADEVLNAIEKEENCDTPARHFANGSASFAIAFSSYLRADDALLQTHTSRVIRSGSGSDSFGGIARVLNALAAASSGDRSACRRASQDLQALPRMDMHGWSWPAFRLTAFAALEEAAGRRDRALAMCRRLDLRRLPLAAVVIAGIHRRAGDPATALNLLHGLAGYEDISYVRIAALATAALVHRRGGRTQLAHEICELALDAAAEEGIRRPFCENELELRQLLTTHLAWGTRHEDFIAGCLAPRAAGGVLRGLSDRERDVLDQLRTTRTRSEIAAALGVSLNTVKTHQQSLYRKLGVSSRREAVRIAT